MKYIRIIFIESFLIFAIGLMSGISHLQAQPDTGDYAKVIYVNGRDVQEVIDQAPAYSTIVGDVISLTGYGDLGFFNRNILVENITAYGSSDRGAVEVSDGNEQITIRNIYADSCRYGVEIQDHSREGQVNSGIVIEGNLQ